MRQPVFNPDFTILAGYGYAQGSGYNPPYGALLFQKAFGVYLRTVVETGGGPDFLSTTRPALNQTCHLVETYDGQMLRIYINGVLESQRPLSGALMYRSGRTGFGIG